MRTVNIKKSDLVEVVTENRNAHRDLYEKAFHGYREECVKNLNLALDAINRGERIQIRIYDVCPKDHTDDYDTVLNMLGLSVDEVIELTHQDFQQYVEDNWNWQEDWKASNSKYYSKA